MSVEVRLSPYLRGARARGTAYGTADATLTLSGVVLADAIVEATWGLVIATSLLVVASVVPVTLTLRERWLARAELAARIIPPLHILVSRTSGLQHLLADPAKADREAADEIEEQLGMLSEVMDEAPPLGLRFVTELVIARHLLTQAQITCNACWFEARKREGGHENELIELGKRARAQVAAAEFSLLEAEKAVPARRVGREPFSRRFHRLSEERVSALER